MPQIGWLEIVAVVIIAILVLGPTEFPLALKKIGSYIGKIKNTLSNFKREVSSVTNEIDIDDVFGIIGHKDSGKHPADKTGNSKYVRFSYSLSDGVAELICFDMSKKLENEGQWDSLYLSLKSEDFSYFITHEEYN